MITPGAYVTYRQAEAPTEQMSELTLANLEAMAHYDFDKDLNVYKVKCRGNGTRPCPQGGTAAVVKYKDK